jgi:hypothetical protein
VTFQALKQTYSKAALASDSAIGRGPPARAPAAGGILALQRRAALSGFRRWASMLRARKMHVRSRARWNEANSKGTSTQAATCWLVITRSIRRRQKRTSCRSGASLRPGCTTRWGW